jgi:ABC-type antimicrobial peptide transport system permease subunit
MRRHLAFAMTFVGIAVVVAIFVMMLAMVRGLHTTLADMGDPSNVIVLGRSSMVEATSSIPRETFAVLGELPEIARDDRGRVLASPEALPVWAVTDVTGKDLQVPLRGIADVAPAVHTYVHLVRGRLPRLGTSEVIVGAQLEGRVAGLSIGKTFRWGRREWTTVGVFEAQRSAFESEVWGDLDGVLDDDHRTFYSSVTLRLKDPASFEALKSRLQADARVAVSVHRELDYYRAQGGSAKPLETSAFIVAVLMAIAAVFGAINTIQASLAGRTREIATMRAIGFGTTAVVLAIVVETLFITLPAGALGCLIAFAAEGHQMNVMNATSFSSVTFGFHITPGIIGTGLLFATVIGISGGLWPAYEAARKSIVEGLRQ